MGGLWTQAAHSTHECSFKSEPMACFAGLWSGRIRKHNPLDETMPSCYKAPRKDLTATHQNNTPVGQTPVSRQRPFIRQGHFLLFSATGRNAHQSGFGPVQHATLWLEAVTLGTCVFHSLSSSPSRPSSCSNILETKPTEGD